MTEIASRFMGITAGFEGIRRRLTTTMIAGIASQGGLVISGALVARSLGVSNRGHLALFQAIPVLLTVVGSLGLPLALTYAIAGYPANARAVLDSARSVAIAQCVGLLALHAVVLAVILRSSTPEVRTAGFITLVLVPALLAQLYGQSILQGQQRFRAFNIVRLLPASLYAVCVIGAYLAGVRSLVAFAAVWSSAASAAGAAAIVVALAGVRGLPEPPSAAEEPNIRKLLRFGTQGILGSASPIESFQLDQIIVAATLSSTALGLYVVGAAFTSLPKLVAQSIGMVAYPDIASRERDALQRLRSYVWLSAGVTLVLVAALAVAAPTIVPAFFGEAFRGSIPLAQLLLVSSLFLSIRRVVIEGARGLGRATLGTAAEAIFLLALVPLFAVFIPRWHVEGVAGGLALASAISLLGALAGLRWPNIAITRRQLERLPPLAAAAVAAFAVACLFPALGHAHGHTRTALVAALGSCVILATLYPLVARAVRGTFDLFEPLLSVNLVLLALFGIRPLAMLLNGQQLDYDRTFLPNFVFTTALALLGTLTFVTMYERFVRLSSDRSPRRIILVRRRRARLFSVGAALLGLLLFMTFLESRGSFLHNLRLVLAGRSDRLETLFSNSSEYLTSAPILGGCGAILLALAAGPYLRFRDRILMVLCAAFPVFYFFVVGGRRFLLPIIGIPIVVRYLQRRRRPSLRLVAIVVPIAFLLFATIVLTRSANNRAASGGVARILGHAVVHPDEPVRLFFTGPDTDMLPNLALEVRSLSRHGGYGLGQATVGDLVLAPVPHLIFPSKPTTARDRMLIRVFGGPCRPSKGLCPDFSSIGTFYQDFWVIGVVVGMALFGWFSALLWRRYLLRPSDLTRTMLAASWFVMAPIVLRAGFNPAFAWFLYFAVPTYIGIRVVAQTRAPGEGPRPDVHSNR